MHESALLTSISIFSQRTPRHLLVPAVLYTLPRLTTPTEVSQVIKGMRRYLMTTWLSPNDACDEIGNTRRWEGQVMSRCLIGGADWVKETRHSMQYPIWCFIPSSSRGSQFVGRPEHDGNLSGAWK
ncbi:hypothetical protein E2C01_095462 [Portunus trituberculatus]|uniref:Uncharacterized protein n=1 Tax=Portunus trituberculatus TaxID=210409 RepID=A0A5B7JZG7_PORTR|nr:hypothetical protein [Portunus trituberculatus]